jgi:hypothetical protein
MRDAIRQRSSASAAGAEPDSHYASPGLAGKPGHYTQFDKLKKRIL